MEEQILEMLNMKSYNLYMGFKERQQFAKEITAHVMEFIEWKDKNIVWDNFNNKFLNHNTGDFTKTNNELYKHWLTKI